MPAKRDGRRIYVSGQVPFVDGKPAQTGKVGEGDGLVSPERAKEMAQLCALNGIAAITSVADLDDVASVVKIVGFVASDPSFTGQPGVVNGPKQWLLNQLVIVDLAVNSFLGGSPYETISSCLFR